MCVHPPNSGVAVLSCTDCSGSSTASSDITDPGSPFSTASTHSEDSAGGAPPQKMPPTQSTDHPQWPWTTTTTSGTATQDTAPNTDDAIHKRHHVTDNGVYAKRLKSDDEGSSPICLKTVNQILVKSNADTVPSPSDKLVNHNNNVQQKTSSIKKVIDPTAKFQHQGKITEYFKSQIKANVIKKDMSKPNAKIVSLVDQQTQYNTFNKLQNGRKTISAKKIETKRKTVTVPRKILPAPSKIPDKVTHVPNLANFTNTVTLTAVSFPPNLAYIHTKSPKPPDNIFVQQFPNKLGTIPCLNVLQPVPKIATLNNFNLGVKLNATMVPIVKLNTLPAPRIPPNAIPTVPFSLETAVPTVLSAKPKTVEPVNSIIKASNLPTPKQLQSTPVSVDNACRNEEKEQPYRTEESQCRDVTTIELSRTDKSPTPDSDSGISSSPKECLQVNVNDEPVLVPEQKSPILSQPKTIRFPVKVEEKDEQGKDAKNQISQDGICRWTDCNSQFTTSGALFDHLQVKHVISQAEQEQYVCLWEGCKVHGKTSCSRSWLERHVLAHAGTKPFRCIVDGCGQRFNSQIMLERHVNGHFTTDGTQNGSAKKTTENGPVKMFKRNGKKIRFRRQPWSARMFDFIDGGIMEGLQYKLLMMTQQRTLGKISNAGDTVNLQSQILARRTELDGSTKILVRWHPTDVVSDEWVSEKEYKPTKQVSIPVLDSSSKDALKPALFPTESGPTLELSGASKRKKHRRKPINQT
ncbi:uncharacterized protein LOC109604411 isoform X2 [Aethina tumida]|uniref:uncharacterized protein LOC109604411 isoform X2 n=1 Tax=Aethina tumida TaxID=116153 RepID=UPI0021477DD1|nr:uncharacterized protein LOC109604411 isoform X2 [Aethina tumida]